MNAYLKLLRWIGVEIIGTPRYISSSCWFDGIDYSLITVKHNVVISANTKILTHDYSYTRALLALKVKLDYEVLNLRRVEIGNNCFIGMASIIMPGCIIGDSSIIGAGSVVRGEIPENSIVVGNPAIVVGNTLDWGKKNIENYEKGIYRTDLNAKLDSISRKPILE
jgi:acetyltransferase-like isoleucine patch superfamily enzyme